MPRFEYETDDQVDDQVLVTDRFADAIALCDLAANAKAIKVQLKQLAKLEKDVRTANEALVRLRDQASGIIEAARKEAARIVKEAEDQVAEERADREHRSEQAAWRERFDRLRAANPSWSDHAVMTAMAETEDTGRSGATFRVRQGTDGTEFVAGSTLTRELPA